MDKLTPFDNIGDRTDPELHDADAINENTHYATASNHMAPRKWYIGSDGKKHKVDSRWIKFNVKVNEMERIKIHHNATMFGQTDSEYIRNLIQSEPFGDRQVFTSEALNALKNINEARNEVKALQAALGKVDGNLNRATHDLNILMLARQSDPNTTFDDDYIENKIAEFENWTDQFDELRARVDYMSEQLDSTKYELIDARVPRLGRQK